MSFRPINAQSVRQVGDLYTIDQAANRLGATYTALSRWIRRNNVERVRLGNNVLVKLEDLSEYRPRY